MESGQEAWEVRHTRSNSVQPPWECESPPSVSSTASTPQYSALSSHHSPVNGGYGSYMDNSSTVASPLEALYRRTTSVSDSTSSLQHDNDFHIRSSSIAGNTSGGGRRQSLSGPLPTQRPTLEDFSSMGYFRRPLSGPLPVSSNNPYNTSFDASSAVSQNGEVIPPLRTLPPWSEIHIKESERPTNPYLNPSMFSPNGSLNASSSNLSPNSLPRPPAHVNGNGNGHAHGYTGSPSALSPSNLSPSSTPGSANGFHHHAEVSPGGAPVRQLYGYASALADPFSLPSPSSGGKTSPVSPSNYEQWAAFNNLSQRSPDPRINLSQRTQFLPASPSGRDNGNSVMKKFPSPGLTRSRSAHNGVFTQNGGALPFNSKGGLNRSVSCSGVEMGALSQKYSKGRGGLGEVVLETLVSQLVLAQEKPCMLADMIFSPTKLSGTLRNSKGPFAYARDLVERILLAQVHALTPFFKDIAQQACVFEKQTWVLSPYKNGQVQEKFPNEGFRLLRLQNKFVEAGLAAFDMLCRVRKQFSSLLADEGGANVGLLRIACLGGGPGCEALAIRLFFMRLLPSLELQVDMFDRAERWKGIVENISLKGVGTVNADLFDLMLHPTYLRSYRLVVFLDILGESMKSRRRQGNEWDEFWHHLHRNTSPGVVVIILEQSCTWETMKPKKGSSWWCSALAEQEKVHVARKV